MGEKELIEKLLNSYPWQKRDELRRDLLWVLSALDDLGFTVVEALTPSGTAMGGIGVFNGFPVEIGDEDE